MKHETEKYLRILGVVLHFIAAVHFSYSAYYMFFKVVVPDPKDSDFGGHFKFLTFWDLLLQFVFFSYCVLVDIFGYFKKDSEWFRRLSKAKEVAFCSLAFPLAFFVAVTFWGIFAYDRELIFPKSMEGYFPSWLNHFVHTNVLIFGVLEMLVNFRKYPRRLVGLSILSAFVLSYLVWILILFQKTGTWPYPVLEVLDWPLRITFFIGTLILILCFYFLGERLNLYRWRSKLQPEIDFQEDNKKNILLT